MINDDIRKLLGGYATNTLTESERKLLFEAALEDQDLFDALQQEQALKDLLAHPVARAEVRQALEQSVPARAWWSRWWAWGTLAGAVAASAVVVVVVQENRPKPALKAATRVVDELPKTVASAPQTRAAAGAAATANDRKSETDRLATSRRYANATPGAETRAFRAPAPVSSGFRDKDTSAPVPPPPVIQNEPAPPSPSPAAVGGVAGQQAGHTQSQTAQAPVQASPPISVAVEAQQFRQDNQPAPQLAKQLDTAANASVANYNGPLVHYSVTKPQAGGKESRASSDTDLKTGDVFRLNISSDISGYLALYQLDRLGEWTRIYPVAAEPMLVTAKSNYTIPEAPLRVETGAKKLRLVLAPLNLFRGRIAAALSARSKSKTNEGASTQPPEPGAPLVVDITIGANKN
jgi:hypothetical protein